MKLNKKGFSLTELLVVVIIIAGFAALTYPSYVVAIERSRVSEAVHMLATIQAAQQKHFMSYEEYGYKFRDINDFTPAAEGFSPDTDNFFTEYYKYQLDKDGSKTPKVTAIRVDKNHTELNKGYNLQALYKENFVRCVFSTQDGEKICASLTDKDSVDNNYYPIY